MPNAYGHDDTEYLDKLNAMAPPPPLRSSPPWPKSWTSISQPSTGPSWWPVCSPNYDFMSDRIGGYSGEKIYYKGNMRTYWARLWINE